MVINWKLIINTIGRFLLFETIFLLISLVVAIGYGEHDVYAFLWTAIITLVLGLISYYSTKNSNINLGKREGYVVVSIAWVIFSFFGCLPYLFSGAIPSFTDAFFETMSGFTTTGSSILNNIEELPHGILFWRSLTQWLGGMGIIVLFLAVLPRLGVGGRELFIAEVPGPSPDKLKPSIKATARRLWGLYLGFTVAEATLLTIGGMEIFDAVNHSLTTLATGGYSTKQASIGAYPSPFIQYVITLFMFIAGVNFTLSYATVTGKVKKLWKDEEFRWYLGITVLFTMLVAFGLTFTIGVNGFEQNFRDSLFTVVSILTTTGYATADYILWAPHIALLVFVLMFFGGSGGSTSGGVKIVRVVLLIKNSYYEIVRLLHPNAVIPVRFNKQSVKNSTIDNIMAFVILYAIVFVVSIVILSFWMSGLDSTLSAVATSLGNIGPGFGHIGPTENFSNLADGAKWFLSFLMLLGRLELFTVLVLFTPAFWKR
ncbi:trk system potassium uptake protein TrkH [Balneicella halophila]|uniref:Trk system potassium uptake protein TrkH n=1 Tax=Balneicella halophila TaxID=1537566 RepID=A0A7L4URK9_BALHA|nr:potassium transporter TrkG [Balneicella halophila]PVX52071.1 trk system potassium uptake protein TrkH [Balneicella halophila]